MTDKPFQLSRKIQVVDMGAYPIDGIPPYRPLLEKQLGQVMGFEPQRKAFSALKNTENERYLPMAVGDGKPHTLYQCKAPGLSSLLKPDRAVLSRFGRFCDWARIIDETPINTYRLDDIDAIGAIDFLKLDVQGSELMILQNGRKKLRDCGVIQIEMPFLPIYREQPTLADIDSELRAQGFIPFNVLPRQGWALGGGPGHQMLDIDFLYVTSRMIDGSLDDESMLRIAAILLFCYRVSDVYDYLNWASQAA